MTSRMTVSSMGLAWAMPVKPNELVAQLEKYEAALPIIHTLRLCHRFGKGDNVHVMKLPVEVEQLIEDLVLNSAVIPDYAHGPDRMIVHFENRCTPSTHANHTYADVFDAVIDDMADDLCDTCQASEESLFSPNCIEGCEKMVDDEINAELSEGDEFFDICEQKRANWWQLINQKPGGGFVRFDKHFGLKAHFATTRATDGNEDKWPENPNQCWHSTRPVQTTTCYLTLPRRSSDESKYSAVEFEEGDEFPCIEVGEAWFVDLPTLEQREKHVRQFKLVRRQLRLKPSIHPSQLAKRISAEVDAKDSGEATTKHGKKNKSTNGTEGEAPTKGTGMLDATKIEWPQLMMLLKASTN